MVWNGEHNFQPEDILIDLTAAKKKEKCKLGEKAIYYTSKEVTFKDSRESTFVYNFLLDKVEDIVEGKENI